MQHPVRRCCVCASGHRRHCIHATEDEAKGSTALIRKVLQQYEREGKVVESQRLRKLFEVEQPPEQEV